MPDDESKELAVGITEKQAALRFPNPLEFAIVERTGIVSTIKGGPPGAQAEHVRKSTVVCRTVGEYVEFANKVMSGQVAPFPPLAVQLPVALAAAFGALIKEGDDVEGS